MKTIAHISDLHFGTVNHNVAEGLIDDLHMINPDLVINSGDFTQRARRSQYQAAAVYVKRLPNPRISVPGNHDVPLFDLFRRFLSPLKRYKEFICGDLLPSFVNDELTVIGINTARSLTWKNGRISIEQIRKVEKMFSELPDSHYRIVVTHHPFIPPPGVKNSGIALVGRADLALEMLEKCRVDLLLAGHLHHGYTGDVRTFYPSSKRSIIVAQAGTAISNRVRNETNSYNLIHLSKDRVEIIIRRWVPAESHFTDTGKVAFKSVNGEWRSVVKDLG
ncbi:metallophosphoesterase family protein [Rhodohalobacter sp. 8-1]|uniref:metallophosphoesterase family protein n=1 Tax=Rhodohalobacter sp. 8-1 TaxID=3131972 RepID=UPI0030ED887A